MPTVIVRDACMIRTDHELVSIDDSHDILSSMQARQKVNIRKRGRRVEIGGWVGGRREDGKGEREGGEGEEGGEEVAESAHVH